MNLKSLACAALIFAAGAASATTTDWGPHASIEVGFGHAEGAGASIDDIFSFSLASPTGLVAVSVANDGANGAFDLTGGTLSLYQVGNSTALGSVNFDSTAISYDFGALAAGNYFYEITATVAPTAQGGSYLVSSTLAPVPEPETYALLLAGLGAVGFMVRRRR